jgi:hypothetical protein
MPLAPADYFWLLKWEGRRWDRTGIVKSITGGKIGKRSSSFFVLVNVFMGET